MKKFITIICLLFSFYTSYSQLLVPEDGSMEFPELEIRHVWESPSGIQYNPEDIGIEELEETGVWLLIEIIGGISRVAFDTEFSNCLNEIELDNDLDNRSSQRGSERPKLYPNPASTQLTIENISSYKVLEVYNVTGKSIHSIELESNTLELNTEEWIPGIHILTFKGDLRISSKSLIIQHK